MEAISMILKHPFSKNPLHVWKVQWTPTLRGQDVSHSLKAKVRVLISSKSAEIMAGRARAQERIFREMQETHDHISERPMNPSADNR